MTRKLSGFALCALLWPASVLAQAPPASSQRSTAELAREIHDDSTLRAVHQMALDVLKSGVNAGSNYRQVWIRDLNTFIEVGLEVAPQDRIREALLTFFKFQGPQGDIVDGYHSFVASQAQSAYRVTSLAPGLMAYKNTVETDQESSLVQAVSRYIAVTGDRSLLEERIAGRTVQDRLGFALRYVLSERFDAKHGLVWGGTRADWGDVQPETSPGVRLDASSHRALCIYDNAMFLIAVDDYIQLLGNSPQAAFWKLTDRHLRKDIRRYLWDSKRQKFIPHVYLEGSPFPKDFDENAIEYHGGTAVAIQAGLLSRKEVQTSLAHMDADVRAAGAASLGLTLYPPYPEGFFKNPQMREPYSYQNGGDWSWFGGRMVAGLIQQGDIAEAYRELQPMVERVQQTAGFHEWWTRQNQPRGSADFRGSAGVLGRDIELLEAWADHHGSIAHNGDAPTKKPKV